MLNVAEPTTEAVAKINAELVRLLEHALADAKSGRIVAGGVVAVIGPSQFMAFSSFSTFPGEVIAGAEVMKANVISTMTVPRSDRIIRAPVTAMRN